MSQIEAKQVNHLSLEDMKAGEQHRRWLHIVNDRLGAPVRIPMMIARGAEPGPVLGLTAAVHGDELNGIPVIQRLFSELDPRSLRGTVVGVLVVNVPGYLREQRPFNDGADLNRIAPGRPDGTGAEVYLHRFVDRVLRKFDVHVDLHTASRGRTNSHYVRADMNDPRTTRLARLQGPQIIVHNPPNDTTLRGTADALGIPSVTVELRDANVVQEGVVMDALDGIRNALVDLGMIEGELKFSEQPTILCQRSYWTYTDEGGILRVLPRNGSRIRAGETLAEVQTIFGDTVRTYEAPEDAVVIGRSINPRNQTGSRIAHLGVDVSELPTNIWGEISLARTSTA